MKRGAKALTLDLVAAEAGISKGGLTYTFPSKEALLSALLDRDVQRFRTRLEDMPSSQHSEPYPELQSFITACRDGGKSAERKVGPILSALMNAPGSLKSTRAFLKWMLAKFSVDTDSGRRARIVFFATQGLYLLQGFKLLAPPEVERSALLDDFVRFLSET